MKKLIALLLVIAMVGTMLVACGNGGEDETTTGNNNDGFVDHEQLTRQLQQCRFVLISLGYIPR